ncbi:hypothetical protein SS50377_24767 [Spironucleus salmonicida]|uniref:Uncharacterized protein n=1 Tax=Spironucleus salmonicida TaxID=348837 RepID=V6LLJ9_9EUKA|nr:hypothetical protein SS50377_24767 [Spironucleus salmonicida]|eukprot:EST44646.1 Hypothetical protein SS50377_15655 [Spironucleus salmonicida]
MIKNTSGKTLKTCKQLRICPSERQIIPQKFHIKMISVLQNNIIKKLADSTYLNFKEQNTFIRATLEQLKTRIRRMETCAAICEQNINVMNAASQHLVSQFD